MTVEVGKRQSVEMKDKDSKKIGYHRIMWCGSAAAAATELVMEAFTTARKLSCFASAEKGSAEAGQAKGCPASPLLVEQC